MSMRKSALLLLIISFVSVLVTLAFYDNVQYHECVRAKRSLKQAGYVLDDLEKYVFEYSYAISESESEVIEFSGREEYYFDGHRFKLFSDFMKK